MAEAINSTLPLLGKEGSKHYLNGVGYSPPYQGGARGGGA